MPIRSKNNTQKSEDFFHMLEKEADHYQVELLKLEESGYLQGMLAIDSSLSPKRKNQLFQTVGIISAHQAPDQAQTNQTIRLAGMESLHRHVSLDLDRVRKCRLPCSLLLVKIKGDKQVPLSETASLMEDLMPGNTTIIQHDNSTLSLLLPGHNLKKSLRQATAIQRSLSSLQTTMGLAICMFRNIPSTETFIKMAEDELKRAEAANNDICYNTPDVTDNSCQVTAEERSQLFSFLNNATS